MNKLLLEENNPQVAENKEVTDDVKVVDNVEIVKNCTNHTCGNQMMSCCGADVLDPSKYNDNIEVRQRIYNEKKIARDNEKLYKEFRKDFNPLIWGVAGLVLGTIFGIALEKVLAVGADVIYSSAMGLFLGIAICINKNKNNSHKHFDDASHNHFDDYNS